MKILKKLMKFYKNDIDIIIHNFKKFHHLLLIDKGYVLSDDDYIDKNHIKIMNEKNYCYLYQENFKETNNLILLFSNKKMLN